MDNSIQKDKNSSICYKKALNKNISTSIYKKEKRSISLARSKDIYLSKIIETQPKVLNDKTLNCSQKSIKIINEIPYVYTNIDILLLNKNKISSLNGIEQFKKIKILDLSDNNIERLCDIFPLKELKNLEVLNIENNTILRNINFNDTIISILPNLKILNGKLVSLDDRNQSKINLKNQFIMLETLLERYCELLRLQSILNRIILHENLIKLDSGFLNQNLNNLNLKNLVKHCKFVTNFDENMLSNLRSNLLEDVQTLQNSLNEEYSDQQKASKLLEKKQIEKIKEISDIIEEKIKELKNSVNNFKKNSENSSIQDKKKNKNNESVIERSEIKLKNILNTTHLNQDESKQNQSQIIIKEIHKSQLQKSFEKNNTSQLKMSREIKNNPNQSYSFIKEKPIKKLINDVSKVSQIINSSTMLSPVKKFISDKDKLISELGFTLNRKIDEINMMEELNNSLRNNLTELQNKHLEIEKKFENQIVDSNLEIKKSNENMKALEIEIKNNYLKINELVLKNHELQNQKKYLEESEIRIKIFEKKINENNRFEELEENSIRFYETNLKKKYFRNFFKNIIKSKKISQTIKENDYIRYNIMNQYYFGQWQRYYYIKKIIKSKNNERNNNILYQTFRKWINFLRIQNQFQRNQINHLKRLTLITFISWKQFKKNREKSILIKKKQENFRKKLIKTNFLRNWVFVYESLYLTPMQEKEKTKKALAFYYTNLKLNFFAILKYYIKEIANPNIQNKIISNQHYLNQFKIKSFLIWKSIIQYRRRQEKKADLAFQNLSKQKISKLLVAWNLKSRFNLIRNKKFNNLKNWFVKKQKFKNWKKNYDISIGIKKLYLKFKSNYEKTLKLKSIKGFKKFWYRQKREKKSFEFLKIKHSQLLMRNIFNVFRIIIKTKFFMSKKIIIIKNNIMKKFLNNWNQKYKIEKRERIIKDIIKNQKENKLKIKIKKIFESLKNNLKITKRNSQIIMRFKKSRNIKIFVDFIESLKKNYNMCLKKHLIEEKISSKNLKDKFDEKINVIETLLNENKDLKKMINEFSEKDEYIKNQLENQKELYKIIEKYKINEKVIKEDNDEKINEIKELNTSLKEIVDEKERIQRNNELKINSLINENEKFVNMISELKSQLQSNINSRNNIIFIVKQKTINNLENDNFSKVEENNSIIKKLENSIEELLYKLTEKDKIINEIELEKEKIRIISQNKEEEKKSKEFKLSKILDEMSEVKSIYETKIMQIENKNKILITDNQLLQEANKNYLNKISDLTTDYKTLECEIKLLKMDENNNIDLFLEKFSKKNNLQSIEGQSSLVQINNDKNTEIEEKNEYSYEKSKLIKKISQSVNKKKIEDNISSLERINKDFEENKINKNQMKENLENRMKMLERNIESDFSKNKREIILNYT